MTSLYSKAELHNDKWDIMLGIMFLPGNSDQVKMTKRGKFTGESLHPGYIKRPPRINTCFTKRLDPKYHILSFQEVSDDIGRIFATRFCNLFRRVFKDDGWLIGGD